MVLVWLGVGYAVALLAWGGWALRSARRKRRKAWQSYYDYSAGRPSSRSGGKRR